MIPRRAAALLLGAALLVSCDKDASAALESVRATDSVRGAEKSVDELKRDIAKLQAEVQRVVKASESLGTYYRMLAVAYLNRQMYGEALGALDEAIRYYPQNETLYYYAGLSAGYMAKAQTDPAEAARLYELAEKHYRRSLFLYGEYQSALFGLAVLYGMELNRPAEAIPLLEKLLARDTSYVEAKALLARCHAAIGEIDEAIELYGQIARADVSAEVKAQALDNVRQLEGRPATTP